MSLSVADVRRIARLARLALSEDEAATTQAQLGSVFGLIERLQAVDTEGVEPMTHPQPMALRLRADEVTEANRRDDFQQVAPSVEKGLYLVPRVIE
ncbi:MAG TPA: Asp-tRNA(Asn)/Glu-tRNA(Gln) amidotransferase subunit GatC [Quisquiliibacterium sp.]|jgi:aspartyl-tRNA(Asn)/glutamyl-tRNA(Gln) amidotransferase subunit C|nr:Asp-tRNA(Asn)/Glu-tRNA(Gln) amidotransferase subunit GatC [Quisquiliibacterium sp.]